ncbi:trimethylamine methyltransferase family protein [Desulfospira joergensenii]|uniref:trimethylamine methyltransferase family protein n=1 Tax=Desulfospira joergensenii TaxID=53329 RepID=UPI0003B5A9FF|nr:trimethylamine methyltransferase family protein [Desulfospira joergensenii]
MINSGSIQAGQPFLKILTQDQIYEIRRAAFDLMYSTGFKVLHAGARKMLKKAGAVVKGERVRVPEFIVKQCLATAPNGFTLYDRNGNRALEVEGRKSYYGTSTGSPRTKDARTGEIHPTTVEDIGIGARVADACEHIDWVMPMGSSQDVPSIAADLYEFEAVVTNTIKPIVFIGYSGRGTELVLEMAAEVAGGMDNLRQKPFLALYPEPISPLVQPEETIDRIFAAADHFIPQVPGPAVQMGATGPMTMAGVITLITAESLMCLVLAQLRQPGCPVCLSGNVQILNMSSGVFGVGYPEMSLGICAQAEVAQSFDLPTWGYAGCSDSKSVDAQAGLESGFSIITQALSGLNLIHDVGYLDQAMVCSPAQLVLGNEAIGMARKFMEGIRVDQETIARQVIDDIGPGGHFLAHGHTLAHCRNAVWNSRLLTREPYEKWQAKGEKDMAQRIQERLAQILDSHKVPPLDDRILAKIREIREAGAKELTA